MLLVNALSLCLPAHFILSFIFIFLNHSILILVIWYC